MRLIGEFIKSHDLNEIPSWLQISRNQHNAEERERDRDRRQTKNVEQDFRVMPRNAGPHSSSITMPK